MVRDDAAPHRLAVSLTLAHAVATAALVTYGKREWKDGRLRQQVQHTLLKQDTGPHSVVGMQELPLAIISRTRSAVRTPCFIAKPSLSWPPVTLNTYPLYSSPRSSPSTSAASRLSYRVRLPKMNVGCSKTHFPCKVDDVQVWS